ncbi:DUF2927 domain-containing protein [Pannonibacter tanglangensis]|nr:DUF2927 domain-containing protein [Pannonibacter sp. XCT-53]
MMPLSTALLLLVATLMAAAPAQASPESFTSEELIEGFNNTVFGLEYRAWSWQPYLVKKYVEPVRFRVHNLAQRNRTPAVEAFIAELPRKVAGLDARLARPDEPANFNIYVVDRKDYLAVVRREIYGDQSADAPGRCLVRVESGRRGITGSSAVIVSDEGEFLFRRCLVEEILQGLGPMNDDPALMHSVFNDTSRHSRFTAFDQILINMLYDPRIRPGMDRTEVEPLLPLIARDAKHRVR